MFLVLFQYGRTESYRVATTPSIPDDNKTAHGKAKVALGASEAPEGRPKTCPCPFILHFALFPLGPHFCFLPPGVAAWYFWEPHSLGMLFLSGLDFSPFVDTFGVITSHTDTPR